jgi:hypothetical protein
MILTAGESNSDIRHYLLTPWSRVPSWEANWFAASQEIPASYGTRRFLTALTSTRHLSLSWASPIHSSHPHPTSWRSILTLPSHLRLGLPGGLFPSGFPTRTLNTPLLLLPFLFYFSLIFPLFFIFASLLPIQLIFLYFSSHAYLSFSIFH